MALTIFPLWSRFWKAWRSVGARGVFSMNLSLLTEVWIRFWMHFAGLGFFGRLATRLATWFAPPYYDRVPLSWLNPNGYVAPDAIIRFADLRLGRNVFIGQRVVLFQDKNGGSVELGNRVALYADIYLQTGEGGSIKIGTGTTVQPRCQFSAYKGSIQIGCDVQIAPNCAFYPYDHTFAPGELIKKQPLQTKGGIVVGDDAWLGFGVIVLDGVRIGKGAVIGAGSVVTRDIPDGAIAVGVPARVVRMRDDADRIDPPEASFTNNGSSEFVGEHDKISEIRSNMIRTPLK
jgi:acetyltransferase-like isoleucine patch superfamily enzyme